MKINSHMGLLSFLLLAMVVGCNPYIPGKKISDPKAGLNGGFEISQNDLPVNWIFYTPDRVEDSNFEIKLDTVTYNEGKQSLRIDVLDLPDSAGFMLPIFTNEFHEIGKFKGKNTYKVSLWIKYQRTGYNIEGGSVTSMGGGLRTLASGKAETKDWEKLEFEVFIPRGGWLRLELAVLEKGTLWVDDVRIKLIE